MKTWLRSFTTVTAALAIGCAGLVPVPSRQQYQGQLESWIGKTEARLVAHFGLPTHSERVDGATVLHWNSSVSRSNSIDGPLRNRFDEILDRGLGEVLKSETTMRRCDLSFTFGVGTFGVGVATGVEWSATIDGTEERQSAGQCGIAFPAEIAKQ